jgi:hypothetical protein
VPVDLLPYLVPGFGALSGILATALWHRYQMRRLELYEHALDTQGPDAAVRIIRAMKTELPWSHGKRELPPAERYDSPDDAA